MNSTDDSFRAIALAVVATALFAGSDTIAKFLSGSLPIVEFIWIRYVISVGFSFAVAGRRSRDALKPRNPALQVIRGICVVASSILFVFGVRQLPMAEATTISFLSPLAVTVLSIPILKEVVGIRRWAAVGAGVAGMLIVVRPGLGDFHPATLFCVSSSCCWAMGLIITRKISGTDTPQTTVLWSSLVGTLVLSLLVPLEAVWPNGWQLCLSLVLGVLASAGQYLVILAHRHAAASLLAPFFYAQLLWVTGLGFLVFHNLPDRWTMLGAGIIIGSGLYTAHRERVRRRGQRRTIADRRPPRVASLSGAYRIGQIRVGCVGTVHDKDE